MDGAEFWFRVDDPKHVVWVRPVGSVSFCKARDCYDRALAVDPNHLKTLHNLGILHDEQGRPAEAQARYDQALAINSSFDALQRVGDLHVKHGRPAEAQDCYERALAIDPKHAVMLRNLGILHHDRSHLCFAPFDRRRGDAAKARDYYEQALAVDPEHVDALRKLGDLHDEQGRPAEARDCYEQALAVDPEDVNTLHKLKRFHHAQGRLHVEQGRPAEAQAHVAEAQACYKQVSQVRQLQRDRAEATRRSALSVGFVSALPEDIGHNMHSWPYMYTNTFRETEDIGAIAARHWADRVKHRVQKRPPRDSHDNSHKPVSSCRAPCLSCSLAHSHGSCESAWYGAAQHVHVVGMRDSRGREGGASFRASCPLCGHLAGTLHRRRCTGISCPCPQRSILRTPQSAGHGIFAVEHDISHSAMQAEVALGLGLIVALY